MPVMTDILMQYLAVVIGEVDEIEELMPDLVSSYLINEEDLNYNVTLYTKFEENGKLKKIIKCFIFINLC